MKLANLFITQSYLFIAFEPFLFLSTFSVFQKGLNIYFFSDDLFANLFNANKLYYVFFLSYFCIQLFHTLIMVQVFQGPGFSESRFFRVQVFLVQIQCLGPGFRSSFKKGVFKNFAIFTGKHLCWSLSLLKLESFRLAISLKRDPNAIVFL